MIHQKLSDFDEEVKPIGDVVTQATVEIYMTVVNRFLPTPTKIHYLFNLRDISKASTENFLSNFLIFYPFIWHSTICCLQNFLTLFIHLNTSVHHHECPFLQT